MKNFFRSVVSIKSMTGLMFMGFMIIYTAVRGAIGDSSIPLSMVWHILAYSFVYATLQMFIYSEMLIKKMNNRWKTVLFGVIFYLSFLILEPLFGLTWTLNKFLIFTGVYLLVFLVLLLSFAIYFKVTGERINQMLTLYKSREE